LPNAKGKKERPASMT